MFLSYNKSMNFLKELNDAQLKAVTSPDGPLLVIAGAGSGKTKVLTYRIAHLIKGGVSPSQVLAVTFTNKAAEEMKKRLGSIIGKQAKSVWMGTFHSVCARILRKEIHQLGYKSNFNIYDEYDKRKLIEQSIKDLDLDIKKHPPRPVAHLISTAKNELIDCETFAKEATDYKEKVVADVYRLYQERLYQNNALDFDDLIMFTVNLFELNNKTLERYQMNFKYLFIDEYQDTNRAQYKLASLLAARNKKICVVGDSDQSIYRWRGADMRNILNFEKEYPNCKVVILEQNYRSTQRILEAANSVISKNVERKPKNLWSAKKEGELLTVFEAADEHAEARFISKTISNFLDKGASARDFAIFYRVNAQSRALEEAFLRDGLPYRIIGGLKFYERQEIKDVLAYLRVLVNENDSVSFRRIINRPRRGIGESTISLILKFCKEQNCNFYEALNNLEDIKVLSQKANANLEQFLSLIKKLKTKKYTSLDKLVTSVLHESGYIKSLRDAADLEAQSRLENLEEFLNVVAEFEERHPGLTLEQFLEEISLISDIDQIDDNESSVTLMTMHNAKGLEFDTVFVAGMEEGLFPHFRAMDDTSELEEERRLCYVSITRAKRKLFLTCAYSRRLYGSSSFSLRSRFLAEVPESLLELAHAPTIQPIEAGEYHVGDVIDHKQFGRGIITEIEDEKATIQFEKYGPKVLLLGYAPISLVD